MLRRLRNWEPKLNKAITDMRSRKFEYGVADCALMACDIVKTLTGTDVAEDIRGTYDRNDVPDLEEVADLIAERWDIEEIHPTYARRGDVVLIDLPTGEKEGVTAPVLGVVDMTARMVVYPLIGGGIGRVEAIKRGRRAWRI